MFIVVSAAPLPAPEERNVPLGPRRTFHSYGVGQPPFGFCLTINIASLRDFGLASDRSRRSSLTTYNPLLRLLFLTRRRILCRLSEVLAA